MKIKEFLLQMFLFERTMITEGLNFFLIEKMIIGSLMFSSATEIIPAGSYLKIE